MEIGPIVKKIPKGICSPYVIIVPHIFMFHLFQILKYIVLVIIQSILFSE